MVSFRSRISRCSSWIRAVAAASPGDPCPASRNGWDDEEDDADEEEEETGGEVT